jgi:hypothetical protein
MPRPFAITSDAPGNAGQSLTPSRITPAFTSANEALTRATEVTCFQRPEGTQKKQLLCKLHKPKDILDHPPGGGTPQNAKNATSGSQVSAWRSDPRRFPYSGP